MTNNQGFRPYLLKTSEETHQKIKDYCFENGHTINWFMLKLVDDFFANTKEQVKLVIGGNYEQCSKGIFG